jgi:putative acetyltransferase
LAEDTPLEIRPSEQADTGAIESLYPEAFPDEDLLPIVRDLLVDEPIRLSLVAMLDGQVAGHVIFTRCGIEGSRVDAALLAPLAVRPGRQRKGIGSAIVRDGIRRLQDAGVSVVFVLGDPAYYSRLGFEPEHAVEPPYPMPPEWKDAWQSLVLEDDAKSCAGRLSVPEQWLRPALWGP